MDGVKVVCDCVSEVSFLSDGWDEEALDNLKDRGRET